MIWCRISHAIWGLALAFLLGASSEPVAARSSAAAESHIISTVLESGNPHQSLRSGDTTIEVANVSCDYSIGCSVEMTIMASLSNASCQNEWAILGLVDGNSVDGGPLQNELPRPGNQQTARWQGSVKVPIGSHTLAFQLYVPCSATADQWSVNYTLARP